MLNIFEYLNLENKNYATIAFIQLINYAYEHDQNIVQHLQIPESYEEDKKLVLGNNAVFQLNLLENNTLEYNNQHYRCLFDVANQTSTVIGKRYLKHNCLIH
jgi:DNA mismatch repair protein MutS